MKLFFPAHPSMSETVNFIRILPLVIMYSFIFSTYYIFYIKTITNNVFSKHLWIWRTCINYTETSCGQWLPHVKMSSGKVSLSSFHLPPSITHHSLSLLLLSPSLTPPRRHFCVCLSPGIPIEDLLRTVAR